MSDKDFLKFNNKQLNFSEFQQKLGNISEKDKQNLSKLLNIFDSDKNGLIETNNSNGINEVKNLWDALKNAAGKNLSGNNNELDLTELNIFGKEYLKGIDNAQNILTNFANTIFNKDELIQTSKTTKFKNNIELTEIQAQNQVINTILDDVRAAGTLYFQQDNGKISDAYDKLKEKDILGDKNLSATKVEEALALQEQTALNLISARDGELTKKEYYLQNKEHLKTMLLRRLYEKDENTGLNFLDRNKGTRTKEDFAKFLEDYIENKINSIQEIDSIKTMQSRLISLEKGEMEKYLLNLLDSANNEKPKFQGIESRFSIDKTIPPEFNSDDLITFEEVFKYERGIEYSKEKVEQLISKTQERQMSIGAFNKFQVYKNEVNELLKDSNSLTSDKIIEFYQTYYENPMNNNLAKEKLSELITKSKLPISLIDTNDGKFNIDLSAISKEENKKRALVNLLKLGLQEQEKLAIEVLGGKPEDRILAINQDYQAAYNSAYGSDFTEEIVKAMEEDNKTFIQKYTGEASTSGMVLIGLGAVLCCTPLAPAGGVMLASGNALALGGMVAESALGTYEAKTRDKVDETELEDLKKTAIMNVGGFIVGFGAGKLGMKVFNKLVDKKLAAIFKDKLSNIGRKEALKEVFTNPEMLKNFATAGGAKLSTDFLISYAGDLVMMGILDPKDDWKSLLQSNLMGIMVGSASDIADVGKFAMNKKARVNNSDARVENDQNQKFLEGKINQDELTEVAPFVKYLSLNDVVDPIKILSDDLDLRFNIESFDMSKYETSGLPLKYSRQEFTQNLKNLVNDLPIAKQKEILEKFNIQLIYTGKDFELQDIPKIPSNENLKTSLDKAIKEEIEKFTNKNEFNVDNQEVKAFLDDFIKIAPEFLFTVGKKQHGTHTYTLDVHTLKVLQNAIEHSEYKNLSSEDKLILNTAILLHDIGKRYIDEKTADEYHVEESYSSAINLLDRFNLSTDIKQRIVKLIENHEFYKQYNGAYQSFKNEENQNIQSQKDAEQYGWSYVPKTDYKSYFNREIQYIAGKFVNHKDFILAKLLTYADLKSVAPEHKYVKNEWNDKTRTYEDVEYLGFEKMVTHTNSDIEFCEYIDKTFSYIENEFSKYKDGKIDEELVYKSELIETSKNLFGSKDFFDRIKRNVNDSYGVHRSDYEFCIKARQILINSGLKHKEAVNMLQNVLKYKNGDFDAKATMDFIQVYLVNREFIHSHNIKCSNYRDADALSHEIDLIKQKENIANIFKEFGIKDESLQKRLSNTLFIAEYQKGTSFNQEAYEAMVELFNTQKYTPEEINTIIYNSFSIKNHRGNFRDSGNCNSEFNRQVMDTILELAKEEPLENAIRDAHLCFETRTPESGWVLIPEYLQAIKEFNQLGVNNKSFLKSLFDQKFKNGANQYDINRILENVEKNEKYLRAIKYAKQGFEGDALNIIINTNEMVDGKVVYSTEVQDKIAKLVKRGVLGTNFGSEYITRQLFDNISKEDCKFNRENYDFMVRMLDTGIKSEQLNSIIYQSLSSSFYAKEAAPDKILENNRFSKTQVEAMVKFFKEIGFDKIPMSSTDSLFSALAESFMDIIELTPEETAKMVDSDCLGNLHKISKMSDYMAPFRYVNEEKFNQALSYYKKGVNIATIKELTATSELYKTLMAESDLSFIKTKADAILVANFWKYKDIKSIDELSLSERINLVTLMMINKSAFEKNNVSEKIPLLPTSSEGYAQIMKDFANSFGYNKTPYSSVQVSNLNKSFSTLVKKLQKLKPSEIEFDSSIVSINKDINNIIPELKIDTKTLQRVAKSPDFGKLSDNDKSILAIATLFSNINSNPIDSAIEASVYAKRMGMNDTDAMKIYVIIKNSNLVETFMSQERKVKVNDSRSYATIISTQLDETFEVAALELKNYNNFQMAKILYTANENYLSLNMIKEYAPDLYQEYLNIRKTTSNSKEALDFLINNKKNIDKIDEIKLKATEKYAPSRYLNKMLENEIRYMKASDVLLPQTDLQGFVKKQSPEWINEHTKIINGRKVLVISSDEIPDFFHLSHTTQAFNITGKADATTNISNFEAFAMLFDNKTICLSYSANGKVAVVGNTGLLVRTDNTSQYLARGTDISSIAKDIPTMVSEYISRRAQIDQRGFQSKRTKDYDRQYFASMIKEEMQPGYRVLLDKKLKLEEEIRNGNSENRDLSKELISVNAQMQVIDDIYIKKLDEIIKKANGEIIDIQFIRDNDAELGAAYDKVLSYINTEHRGNDGLMRTEYHNEVLASNTIPVGIFVTSEKALFELTDDYLQKAEEELWPVVVLK